MVKKSVKESESEVLPLREVKARFSELVDQVSRTHQRVVVTRNGRPAAVLVSPDDIDTMQETLEVLANRDLLEQLVESRDEMRRRAPLIPLEKVLAERRMPIKVKARQRS
jgi:prevent-host-death family protein